ncbi:MAG TPA: lysylphosphatidylglycerol synthase domain-containing protein [Vicinamibacterales bacterium]|nr:lysylphosphatidylglycerol synthase domain-containing protein [Vicinamibacterales bacterium]
MARVVGTPAVGRKRGYLALAAAAGVGLFGWTIASVGARELASQLHALAPIVAFILALAAARFWLQAAGWRLAMPPAQRPTWRELFGAVVAGEAAGYFAWGAVSREPMKALLVGHRLPERAALGAAVVERFYYSLAATALIVAGIALAAVRYHFVGWFLVGTVVTIAVALVAKRCGRRFSTYATHDRSTALALVGLALAQEATNLVEAYLVLAWVGAAPTIASVVVLEGVSRLLNSAGQFIPGKLGVTEAATTALAQSLSLGGPQGLSLALARRARSLVWGAGGIGLLAVRAASRPAAVLPPQERMAA